MAHVQHLHVNGQESTSPVSLDKIVVCLLKHLDTGSTKPENSSLLFFIMSCRAILWHLKCATPPTFLFCCWWRSSTFQSKYTFPRKVAATRSLNVSYTQSPGHTFMLHQNFTFCRSWLNIEKDDVNEHGQHWVWGGGFEALCSFFYACISSSLNSAFHAKLCQ